MQEQGSLRIGIRGLRHNQTVKPLARDAQQTSQPGLCAGHPGYACAFSFLRPLETASGSEKVHGFENADTGGLQDGERAVHVVEAEDHDGVAARFHGKRVHVFHRDLVCLQHL